MKIYDIKCNISYLVARGRVFMVKADGSLIETVVKVFSIRHCIFY